MMCQPMATKPKQLSNNNNNKHGGHCHLKCILYYSVCMCVYYNELHVWMGVTRVNVDVDELYYLQVDASRG